MPEDITINGLSTALAATAAIDDLLPIWDTSAGAMKKHAAAYLARSNGSGGHKLITGSGRELTVSATGTAALYSAGAWTPDLRFGGAKVGLTYTSRYGYYTQLGNAYLISCAFTLADVGSSTGLATVYGLPATSSVDATGAFWVSAAKWFDANANYVSMGAYIFSGHAYYDLMGLTAAGSAWSEITHAAFKAGTQFAFSGIFFV